MSDGPAENRFDRVTFVYRNWRGDIAERTVAGPQIVFRISPWHGGKPCLFLTGCDTLKGEIRDFKLDDILTPLRSA